MSFIIQRISGAGILVQEYKSSTLTIGRGTNTQLRSENPSVALEHATIEGEEGGFDLYDRGSITGTYLNGRAVENARLGAGDVIEIGDLLISVQAAQPGKPLFLRVEILLAEGESIDEVAIPIGSKEIPMPATEGAALKAPKVDYARSYALKAGILSKAAISSAILVALTGVLLVVFGAGRNELFRPGELSVAHTEIASEGVRLFEENNCVACHEPWGGAPDAKCRQCHGQAGHRRGLPETGSCGDCHTEHRQSRRLAEVVDRRCVDCHQDLRGRLTAVRDITVANNVSDFGRSHPDFKIVLDDARRTRVLVHSDKGRVADTNPLTFNHKCHVSGKCNTRPPTATNPNQEKEKLDCASCHQIDAASGAMLPLSYEVMCARCHPLTFDNRFAPVPHRLDLQTVAGVIANAYSGNESLLRMSAEEVAGVFAKGRGKVNLASAIVRNAQRTLEARCKACHMLSDDGTQVIPPRVSRKWFAGMRVFDHRSHLNEGLKAGCADCHEGSATSEKSSDLGLPGIDDCTPCHRSSDSAAASGIGTCQTCHYFHELSLAYGEGWTLQTADVPAEMKAAASGIVATETPRPRFIGLPLWAAVILPLALILLVGAAGVVVGAARTIAKRPKEPVESETGQMTPDQVLEADLSRTDEDEPKSVEPSTVPPATAVPDATVAMDLSDVSLEVQAALPTKTIATEYFGSIVFTSGALEGRRFVVDADRGTYIGRDSNLADIVIDDERISRRHMWIGVRGESVTVVDQGSTNGTFLDGKGKDRVEQARLEPGDVVILGESAAAFRYEP